MSLLLDVDPGQAYAASRIVGGELAPSLQQLLVQLGGDLAGTNGSAGADRTCVEWAEQYDAAARRAADALGSLADAAAVLAALLERTGFNHGLADAASDSAHPRLIADARDYLALLDADVCVDVPSALGGGADAPNGWGVVVAGTGIEWPGGHPDRARQAGIAWRSVSIELTDRLGLLDDAMASLALIRSPEVADALGACRGLREQMTEVAAGAAALADGCHDYAQGLADAQRDITTAVGLVAGASAGVQVLGLLFAVETVGTSEVAAEAAETGAVSIARATVVRVLTRFVGVVTQAWRAAADVAGRLALSVQRLEPLLAARPVAAVVEQVPRVEGPVVETVEEVATDHLVEAARLRGANLDESENLGGHAIKEHVGKSDQYLIDRNISKASTFPDKASAQAAIDDCLDNNQVKIDRWLDGDPADEVLKLRGPLGNHAGRVYIRKTATFVAATRIEVRLIRTGNSFYVVTAFVQP